MQPTRAAMLWLTLLLSYSSIFQLLTWAFAIWPDTVGIVLAIAILASLGCWYELWGKTPSSQRVWYGLAMALGALLGLRQ